MNYNKSSVLLVKAGTKLSETDMKRNWVFSKNFAHLEIISAHLIFDVYF